MINADLFIGAYARLIYMLFIFLLKSTYRQPEKTRAATSFSANKHTKMMKLSPYAAKVFDILVSVVSKKTRYDYTMPVEYEHCKLLIRPFIYFEILMVSGLWEPFLKGILADEIKNSDIVVDVGANIGIYVIPLAKRISKVIAFEPHPKTSEMLERSIKLNRLHNVLLIKKPAGKSKERVLFSLSVAPMNSGINPHHEVDSIIESETIDLDSILAMEDRVDWLLIDVEGYEVNVVEGARKVIQRCLPKIIIEIIPENFDKINEILTKEGYSLTHIYGIYYYAIRNN